MTPKRKSIGKILASALKKCELFRVQTLCAWCTPQEYIVLCWYFGYTPPEYEYYLQRVKQGDSKPGTHYVEFKKTEHVFPKSRYYIDF